MLWDPDGPARKPPQDSVELLLSVVERFDLYRAFRVSADPDFLLLTIGETSRSSIERAYDWLIPIISDLPTTITRLPPNTSCFLLLRAYASGDGGTDKLKELSQPLLQHVKDSLVGSLGVSGAVKALDLLLTDAASSKSSKRRCARRVLSDAIPSSSSNNGDSGTWMLSMLSLPNAKDLVKCSLPHLVSCLHFVGGCRLTI